MPSSPSDIAFVDFETYYDSEFSLSNRGLTMTQYVRDPRFRVHMVGVKLASWPEPRVMSPREFADWVVTVDWRTTAFAAHHCHFDGFILTHHYGVYPCRWIDTLSMSRLIFGVDVSHKIGDVAERLGGERKVDEGKALHDLKGVVELSPEQYESLIPYTLGDVRSLEYIYTKMRPAVPDSEMAIIDTTVAMYCEPILELDDEVTESVRVREGERKEALLAQTQLTRQIIGSADKFAAFLEERGVEVPMKISPRTGNPTYAFAKTDLEFQELLDHPDPVVSAAVEARLGTKGSLVETRSARMLTYAGQPMPIYLSYWAARTGRWGGGDRSNWQNLPRKGLGAELRRAIAAPTGYSLIPSDASQIEARLLAWRAGQLDIVEIFAANGDVYGHNATSIYGWPVNKDDHPDQRFVGKVFTLGAGFGAGHKKMNHMLRSGAMGPKVDISLEETDTYLKAWRYANWHIVEHWNLLNEYARLAFLSNTQVEDGPITWEGYKGDGYIHLPNGTYIRYRNIRWHPEAREMTYDSRNGLVKLYGGILEENTVQALARVVFAEHINRITETLADVRVALLVHDDVVSITPDEVAQARARSINQIMSTPPAWATGLPLNAETKVGKVYGKAG